MRPHCMRYHETMNTHWAPDVDGQTLGDLDLPNDAPLVDVAALAGERYPGTGAPRSQSHGAPAARRDR